MNNILSIRNDVVCWIGIGICGLSVLIGLYFGVWVCLIGGIVAVITGFQSDPWNSMQIALGVVRFISAGIVGWASFALVWAVGMVIIKISEDV